MGYFFYKFVFSLILLLPLQLYGSETRAQTECAPLLTTFSEVEHVELKYLLDHANHLDREKFELIIDRLRRYFENQEAGHQGQAQQEWAIKTIHALFRLKIITVTTRDSKKYDPVIQSLITFASSILKTRISSASPVIITEVLQLLITLAYFEPALVKKILETHQAGYEKLKEKIEYTDLLRILSVYVMSAHQVRAILADIQKELPSDEEYIKLTSVRKFQVSIQEERLFTERLGIELTRLAADFVLFQSPAAPHGTFVTYSPWFRAPALLETALQKQRSDYVDGKDEDRRKSFYISSIEKRLHAYFKSYWSIAIATKKIEKIVEKDGKSETVKVDATSYQLQERQVEELLAVRPEELWSKE